MKEKIKVFQTIHLAFCLALSLAYIVAAFLWRDSFSSFSLDSSSLLYLAIPIAAFILGNVLFRSQLKNADPDKTVEENLSVYQSASLIRWAVLEAAAIMLLLFKPYLIFGIPVVLYLILLRPTEEKIESDLRAANY